MCVCETPFERAMSFMRTHARVTLITLRQGRLSERVLSRVQQGALETAFVVFATTHTPFVLDPALRDMPTVPNCPVV